MPGASPQSNDASGLGSSKMGTSSRWHHEWLPHLSQFLNLPPSTTTQWVDNKPTQSAYGGFSPQKVNNPEYQPAYSLSLDGTPSPPSLQTRHGPNHVLVATATLGGNVSAPGARRASFVTRALPVDCCR